jgi:hypothetical protein
MEKGQIVTNVGESKLIVLSVGIVDNVVSITTSEPEGAF